MTKHRGWICAKIADKKLLQSMGIKIGYYNQEDNLFDDCIIPDTAIPLLDDHFGILMYGLLEKVDGDK